MSACNLCWPLCQCGAEAEAAKAKREAKRAALLRDAARWPELEEMERTLANYGEAK